MPHPLRLRWNLLFNVALLFVISSSNNCLVAADVLPPITVTAKTTLNDQVNNVQYLDEDDITVAHERTVTDVIQGFPGVSTTKVSLNQWVEAAIKKAAV